MEWSTTRRMTNSMNELLGDRTCSEVLLVHERPRWVWAAVAGVSVVAIVLTILVEPLRPLASVFALLVAMTLSLPGRRWVLARSGRSVFLAESPRLFPKAERIVAEERAPIPGLVTGGVLTKWVVLFERRLVISRLFQRSLWRIVG